MTSRKKLVKTALQHPELHTEGELAFFRLWLSTKKAQKKLRKKAENEGALK
jgi:hypothetical protein